MAPPADNPLPLGVVQELLQEAWQSQEQPKVGSGPPPITIPLQLPNKDVATGPLPTPQDYEAVPVGPFELAMLRDMGWGQDIGSTFPGVLSCFVCLQQCNLMYQSTKDQNLMIGNIVAFFC